MVNTATIHINSGVMSVFFFNNNSMILVLPSPHKAARLFGAEPGLTHCCRGGHQPCGAGGISGRKRSQFSSVIIYIYINGLV